MPRVHLLLIPVLVGLLVFSAFLLVEGDGAAPRLRDRERSDRAGAPLPRRTADTQVPAQESPREESPAAGTSSGPVILASGQVLDADGAPFPGVWVRLASPRDDGSGSPLRRPSARTAADGSFMLIGAARERLSLLLEPPDEEHFPALLDGIACGTKDLAPRLYRGATLSGRLIPPEGMSASWFSLRVLEGEAGELGPGTIAAADGSYRIDGIRPVSASVVVGIVGSDEIVHEIDDLEFESGRDLRDPRLQTIDLRGRVPRMLVEVVNDQAAPLPNARVIVVARRSFDDTIAFTMERSDAAGRIHLPRTGVGLDIEIARRGYRLRKLRDVADDICVILERAAEIRLQLRASGFSLPPGVTMELCLASHDRRRIGGDVLLEGRVPDRVETVDRLPAEVGFPLEVDGDYELEIVLLRAEHREEVGRLWVDLRSAEPEKTLRLDSLRHALDRALTRLEEAARGLRR